MEVKGPIVSSTLGNACLSTDLCFALKTAMAPLLWSEFRNQNSQDARNLWHLRSRQAFWSTFVHWAYRHPGARIHSVRCWAIQWSKVMIVMYMILQIMFQHPFWQKGVLINSHNLMGTDFGVQKQCMQRIAWVKPRDHSSRYCQPWMQLRLRHPWLWWVLGLGSASD